jgi:hypothetical protein
MDAVGDRRISSPKTIAIVDVLNPAMEFPLLIPKMIFDQLYMRKNRKKHAISTDTKLKTFPAHIQFVDNDGYG